DAEFAAERLRTVLPRLQARQQEVAAAEYLTQWRADCNALRPVGDALAAELHDLYPRLARQLVDLVVRIKAHNADLSSLHERRPAGVPLHLGDPELVARGIDAFSRDTRPLAEGLQLPAFEPGQRPMYPPPTVP